MRKIVVWPPVNGLPLPGRKKKKDTKSKRRLGKRQRMEKIVLRQDKSLERRRGRDA